VFMKELDLKFELDENLKARLMCLEFKLPCFCHPFSF
jgi:hypothetical protein